jgi:formate-dependent nitrite reductase membrane component NrfD
MTDTQQMEMMCAPRAQMEWGFGGRRRFRDGALLIALFLGGIGAGQFVVSLWAFDPPYLLGAVVGLIFVAVGKSAAHLAYLGRPARFFRLFMRPRSSWISRGFIAMIVMIVFGIAYLAPYLAPYAGMNWTLWSMQDPISIAFLGIAIVAAFIVMIYDGFVLNSCKSISSWHTMLLPVMFFIYAVAGGVAMTALLATIDAGSGLSTEEIVTLDTYLLSAMFAMVVFYIMNLYTSDVTGKESLRRLLMSRTAIFFVGLALVAGLLIPLLLTALHQFEGLGALATAVLAISALLELAGDLSVRHSILKAGLHAPVL